MKRRILALALALLFSLPALAALADADGGWEPLLPDSFDAGEWRYPAIYVLEDAAAGDSGLAQVLLEAPGMDMIVVRVPLQAGEDALAVLRRTVDQVDAAPMRTIPDAAHRFVAGTGAGGYLAYMAALEEDGLFGGAVSIRGDLAGADNHWLDVYGPLGERMRERLRADKGLFDAIYTYMDAPADDPWTDLPGSTDDLGAMMIGWGVGSASHEFTVRPGAFDDAFLRESAARVKDRLGARMLSGALTGALDLEKATLAPDERTVRARYTLTAGEALFAHAADLLDVTVRAALYDAQTGAILAGETRVHSLGAAGEVSGSVALDAPADCAGADVRLSVELLGGGMELASAGVVCEREARLEGDRFALDLAGDWHFHYTGTRAALDAAALGPDDWADWPLVQPGMGNWTKGFGDISDANVSSVYGPDYFDYFITGNGYYAREFTLPEGAAALETVLSIGYIDDRCEVWINGHRVGGTGMDAAGRSTGETTWAACSSFPVDGAILCEGDRNTIVVRAWNDLPYGAGGWYAGPIGLYSRASYEAIAGDPGRFLEESFDSVYAARAADHMGTAEVQYLVYLPADYETSGRSYPTLYLLHQLNSDHTSYRTDGVDALLDAGAAAGLFDEMIVVVPNSSEQSWWRGNWEKMLTEELVPHIDENYRTIRDARYRLTAGCSMGGQGAMGVALRNGGLFSGAISFYGAFTYGGEADPRAIAAAESAEYIRSFSLAVLCGNQDSYGFGMCAVDLHQALLAKDAEHLFIIENGGHNGAFYLPRFQEALAYVRAHMYQSDAAVEGLLHGELALDGAQLRAALTADDGVAAYLYAAPASTYTQESVPSLSVPLRLELVRDGETVYACEARDGVLTADGLCISTAFPLDEAGDLAQGATAVLSAEVFDRLVPLASVPLP